MLARMANRMLDWWGMQTVAVPITNGEFARRVGCHFTMASRLRNGRRFPSTGMLARMFEEFDIDDENRERLFKILADVSPARADNFGLWMRTVIFLDEAA
jgi:transcriptional regulator with XRE-family HTH domain